MPARTGRQGRRWRFTPATARLEGGGGADPARAGPAEAGSGSGGSIPDDERRWGRVSRAEAALEVGWWRPWQNSCGRESEREEGEGRGRRSRGGEIRPGCWCSTARLPGSPAEGARRRGKRARRRGAGALGRREREPGPDRSAAGLVQAWRAAAALGAAGARGALQFAARGCAATAGQWGTAKWRG